MTFHDNVDPDEIAKFEKLASRWWDPNSEFKPLHDINPLRADWIDDLADVRGKSVLDVGCGGGLLCEALVHRGARVTGIDMGEAPLSVARLHQLESGIEVSYEQSTAESFAQQRAEAFDVVTCLEMLEHVPDPAAVVSACAALCRPGGDLFFSTINRTVRAYLLAILGAEHLLKLLPAGTHHYEKFIRPSELGAWCRQAGLEILDISGVMYLPFLRRALLGGDTGVNYLVHAQRARHTA